MDGCLFRREGVGEPMPSSLRGFAQVLEKGRDMSFQLRQRKALRFP